MVFGLFDQTVGEIVELLYLLTDWLSLIIYEAVMDTLVKMILALIVMGIIIHLIYKRYYD